MTTLPQTTPTRMPRLTGPGQLSVPGPNGSHGSPQAAAAAGPLLSGADVWRVIRSNWWLIGGIVFVCLVGGYFLNSYLKKYHSRFESTGYVKVESAIESTTGSEVRDLDRSALEVEQQTQARMLLHSQLLLRVLQNADNPIRQTHWLKQFEKPGPEGRPVLDVAAAKDDLLEVFDVAPLSNSRLIAITATTSVPKDAKVIVEEIVKEHIRQQRESVQARWMERAKSLNDQRNELAVSRRTLNDNLARQANSLSSDGLNPRGSGVKLLELSKLIDDQIELENKVAKAEASYKGLSEMRDRGEIPPAADDLAQRDPSYNYYRQAADESQIRIDSEVAVDKESAKVRSLKKQKEGYEQARDNRFQEARNSAMLNMLSDAQSDVNAAKNALERITERADRTKAEVAKLNARLEEYDRLVTDEKDVREKLRKVDDDLAEIEKQRLPMSWSPVDWAPNSAPTTPELPSFPKLHWTLTAAALVGLTLSLGIAFLRELTDTTVRSPRDVTRIGQMNLLGMVPHEADDRQAAGARLPLVIFDAPYSMAAEEYRKLRTRLQHMASLDTTRSILVTGPSAGDGKTTVACNLATGLALNGRRILLVDANFRRPEVHKAFGMENSQGFGDVLNTPELYHQVVRETPIPNLSIMTCGARPGNATELLESQLLIDFIERALEEYDHVVFDGGAILISSETLALAPRVDGVITVVRAGANGRGVLQRTRDTLRQVKAEHLGVVINAVRSQAGGYYGRSIVDYYKYSNG